VPSGQDYETLGDLYRWIRDGTGGRAIVPLRGLHPHNMPRNPGVLAVAIPTGAGISVADLYRSKGPEGGWSNREPYDQAGSIT